MKYKNDNLNLNKNRWEYPTPNCILKFVADIILLQDIYADEQNSPDLLSKSQLK